MLILGVDAGNENGKVVGEAGEIIFKTALAEFREGIEETFGADDMVIEHEGNKYLGGSVAKYDGEFSGAIMGANKAHQDTLIRVLAAIHRYMTAYSINEIEFKVVVGQPIDFHQAEEKKKIISMLKKKQTITINDYTKTFIISDVLVSKESPFWATGERGLVRLIDAGSGTINLSTFLDKKFISKDSWTLPYGMESTKSKDRRAMARGIIAETSKKWDRNDKILLAGGGAREIIEHLQGYYTNLDVLRPKINGKVLNPIYSNAVSFYQIGKGMF